MIIDCHVHYWDPKYQSSYHKKVTLETRRKENKKDYSADTKYLKTDISSLVEEWHTAGIDKLVLLGKNYMRILGARVPDKIIADCVKKYPDTIIGFTALEPLDSRNRFNKKGLDEFVKAIENLGLKGLKLLPTYGHYRPDDKTMYPVYEKCVELDVPILIHQGAGCVIRNCPAKYTHPVFLDDVAEDFPDLRLCVAHLGDPEVGIIFSLMAKNRNMYADVASLCARPYWLAWNLVVAKEYRVLHKILFGSDGPGVCRPVKKYIEYFRIKLNQIAENSGWPTFSKEEIDGILGENAKEWLKL
jgi:predicted TIM-barrel fold metal-dependent hydrolase